MTLDSWKKLSFYEQMGNIGSEVSRALNWRDKDIKLYENATNRAFELLDLTIADSRWHLRLKEIVRARELLADAMFGGKEYKITFEDLNNYFFHFALAARISK
ncbi:MAG: hypothetical protein ABIJ19_00350 [Patescibacteria group bacterium]